MIQQLMPSHFNGLPLDSLEVEQFVTNISALTSLWKIQNPEKLFPLFLKGPAYVWYASLDSQTKSDFTKLSTAFLERYRPSPILKFARVSQLFKERQGTEKVLDFMDRIIHECHLVQLSEDIIQQILLNGLLPAIRTFVLQNQPQTVQKLKELAVLAEVSISTVPDEEEVIAVKNHTELTQKSNDVASSQQPRYQHQAHVRYQGRQRHNAPYKGVQTRRSVNTHKAQTRGYKCGEYSQFHFRGCRADNKVCQAYYKSMCHTKAMPKLKSK